MTFLSLEHLEAIIWYLIAQFQCCCVSGNREAQGDREMGKWLVGGAVRTLRTFVKKVCCLCGHGSWCPKTLIVNTRDHRSP